MESKQQSNGLTICGFQVLHYLHLSISLVLHIWRDMIRYETAFNISCLITNTLTKPMTYVTSSKHFSSSDSTVNEISLARRVSTYSFYNCLSLKHLSLMIKKISYFVFFESEQILWSCKTITVELVLQKVSTIERCPL